MKINFAVGCLIITFIAAFTLMIIHGKKSYRYECQDPNKYHLPQCQPPVCEVSGFCTQYLIGDVDTKPADTTPTVELIPQVHIIGGY